MPTAKSDHRVDHLQDGDESEEGIDLAKVKMILGFFLRAPKRRPALAIIAPVVPIALALALAAWMPRTYTADMRVIAHKSAVLPEHSDSAATPEPTAGVVDEIMRRDNLEALVKNLDLVPRWTATRPPMLKLKDWATGMGRTANPDETMARAIIGSLEKNLQVTVEAPAITISVDWPDAQMAYDLVTNAYKSFLDNRAESEVNLYTERLTVLKRRAEVSAQDVDAAIAELTKREAEHRRQAGQPLPAPSDAAGALLPPAPPAQAAQPAQPAPPGQATQSAAAAGGTTGDDLAHALEDVRAQIRALEEEQQRRVAAADAQLADAQGSLGPLHPTVLALKRKADAAREPIPQLDALRAKEKDLVAKLAADVPPPSGAPAPVYRSSASSSSVPGVPPELREMLLNRDDPPTAYARSKLQSASQQYNDVLSRMQLAKIELDVARESFKETYQVVRPAEVPVKPRKPNVLAIVVGGFVLALLLAFVAPGARDLMTGRYLEPWQVEDGLKIPLLGVLPPGDSHHSPAQDAGPSA
ncbi:MAG TPA: hypothetical protein VGM06_12710 [Polyangiaceae bacterium]|jgi:uncharacterized protein involved in exopolysaccharide biosynthesis